MPLLHRMPPLLPFLLPTFSVKSLGFVSALHLCASISFAGSLCLNISNTLCSPFFVCLIQPPLLPLFTVVTTATTFTTVLDLTQRYRCRAAVYFHIRATKVWTRLSGVVWSGLVGLGWVKAGRKEQQLHRSTIDHFLALWCILSFHSSPTLRFLCPFVLLQQQQLPPSLIAELTFTCPA